MGQVKEGAGGIPQLHRHGMPEGKRAYALGTLGEIEVQNRCEATGHERHKSEDPRNRESASDEHHPLCLQPWRNGVQAAGFFHKAWVRRKCVPNQSSLGPVRVRAHQRDEEGNAGNDTESVVEHEPPGLVMQAKVSRRHVGRADAESDAHIVQLEEPFGHGLRVCGGHMEESLEALTMSIEGRR